MKQTQPAAFKINKNGTSTLKEYSFPMGNVTALQKKRC